MTAADIRVARERAGFTQAEAAALLGWTRDAWAKLESGERTMREQDWRYFMHVSGLERMPFRAVKS